MARRERSREGLEEEGEQEAPLLETQARHDEEYDTVF